MNEETLLRFRQLKDQLANHQREIDRVSGSLDTVKASLEPRFGCKTVQEARKLLERKRRELNEKKEKFEQDLQEFEEKHGHLFGGDDE